MGVLRDHARGAKSLTKVKEVLMTELPSSDADKTFVVEPTLQRVTAAPAGIFKIHEPTSCWLRF